MKPNPFGFNLNFDEFLAGQFGGARLPNDLTAIPKPLLLTWPDSVIGELNAPSRDLSFGHGTGSRNS